MAEEVRGSVQGGNGERLELRLGTKSIGLQVKDLIPILLLVIIGLGGYLLYTTVEHRLDLIYQRQETQLNRLQAMDEQRIQQTLRIHRLLEVHDYNAGRPQEERLPLVLEPPLAPKAGP